MDLVQRFWEYVEMFERVYVTDDWSLLIPFFTEDAVYEIIGQPPLGKRLDGRDAFFSGLKQDLDNMDRRFEKRDLGLIHGPELRGDHEIWIHWAGTYRYGDLPDLVFEGEEVATYRDGRIARLEDRYTEEVSQRFATWWATYAKDLPAPKS